MKTLLLILIPWIASAQVYRFTGEAVSMKYTYGEWSEWEKAEVLIILNIDKDIINIYSKREQRYDIISISDKIYNRDTESLVLDCVDEEGIRCTIKLVNNTAEDYRHLYIRWSNLQYVYQIVAK
jgi:transcription elongation factor